MRLPGFVLLALSLGAVSLSTSSEAQQPPRRPPPVPARRPAATPRDTAKKVDSAKKAVDTTAKASENVIPRMPMGSVFGTLFDSVHRAPLAQAVVVIGPRSGISTDRGIFRVDSLPPGKYRVMVDHPFLDSIGVGMVSDTIDVQDGSSQTLQLAIPSGETLTSLSCPAARRALGPSAIIGRLLDAETEEPVKGARVSMAWEEMSLNANLRKVPRLRDALSGEDGVFRICGLPGQIEGTLQAQFKGVSTAEVRLKFEGEHLIVQGLKIAQAGTVTVAQGDSAANARQREAGVGKSFSAATVQRGSASLTGRVLNATGAPVVGARVDVIGTPGATLTSAGGEFRIDSLPSGTQSLVVRQIGFAPVEQAVELSTRAPARVTVTMTKAAQVLAAVRVEANADAGLDKVGFTQRRRSGMGHYVTGEDISKRAPNMLTDLFRTIPGLRVVPSGTDYVVESSRQTMGGCVRYWVDGAVWEAVFPGDVDRLVPPWEIAAVEVYNGSSTPVQFQMAGNSSCASIVIWTKTRTNAPPGRRSR